MIIAGIYQAELFPGQVAVLSHLEGTLITPGSAVGYPIIGKVWRHHH